VSNDCGSSTSPPATLTVTSATCNGDFNGDGVIDLTDLSTLLAQFGCTSGCSADMDSDGDVDLTDLATLLALYGHTCP
jgi:hypothetical protein